MSFTSEVEAASAAAAVIVAAVATVGRTLSVRADRRQAALEHRFTGMEASIADAKTASFVAARQSQELAVTVARIEGYLSPRAPAP